MTTVQHSCDYSKSKGLVILEYILFALCLSAIALRITFTEGTGAQSAGQSLEPGGSIYSLSISAVLLLSCVLWFVWGSCSRRFCYRFSGMEIGLCVFATGAVIAVAAAANKRAALSDIAMLVAPVLMAILLVQILDTHSKVKLLLVCIAALGVVSAYQSAQQLFFENQAMIDQYEQAPWTMLEPLGIKPGTLQHFLFEHRLYTKGVQGFFTTANSAGSFALLACFAAVALFLEQFKNGVSNAVHRRLPASDSKYLITSGLCAGVIIFGLFITKSKGAIAAAVIAAAALVIYFLFGEWINRRRRAVLTLCLLLGLAAGGAIILYGLAHGRLPGGKSMFVRWQYWQASAKMFADHPFTGVGPGNFTYFYTHYKPAAALESVADPHNFLLSVLTQYGPLGLIGFLAMVLAPLCRVILAGAQPSVAQSPAAGGCLPPAGESGPAFRKLVLSFAIVIAAVLLLVRPVIMPVATGGEPDVIIYAMFFFYIAPVGAFIVGIWLLAAAFYKIERPLQHTNIVIASLFCACLGVLLHNLIDFAIFEPGVFMTFCAVIASLAALDCRRPFVLKPTAFTRVIAVAAAAVITFAYFNYCLMPVVKSVSKIKKAVQAAAENKYPLAYDLLNSAAEDDNLSPLALSLAGRLYFENASIANTGKTDLSSPIRDGRDLLMRSQNAFLAAIRRNPADFKNFEHLAKVYNLLAETSAGQERTDWLNKALDAAQTAVELYPGMDRLRLALAKIAEKSGKTDIALSEYQKAIEIEDAFRAQFQMMYPQRKMFSRLGEDTYQFALERIKELKKQQKEN